MAKCQSSECVEVVVVGELEMQCAVIGALLGGLGWWDGRSVDVCVN